ncbi:unnamed protein product [Schistosoma mattheei]|uniref:Uncharacterized protein n=1 Tax=Schistosoma mattheei TaxID=31246 RepID=A0A183NGE2_9TREM|nr:unnamed protein product [Schistosoma mattheei]
MGAHEFISYTAFTTTTTAAVVNEDTVDQLQNQWDSVEQQMIERSEKLDQMLSGIQTLKELERDVEREISKTEADLQSIDTSKNQSNDQSLSTSRILVMTPETCRKHLQVGCFIIIYIFDVIYFLWT